MKGTLKAIGLNELSGDAWETTRIYTFFYNRNFKNNIALI